MTERKSPPDFSVRQSILCFLFMIATIIFTVVASVVVAVLVAWIVPILSVVALAVVGIIVAVRMGQIAANQVRNYGGFGLKFTNLDNDGRLYRSYRQLWLWLVWIYALVISVLPVIWFFQGLQNLAAVEAEEAELVRQGLRSVGIARGFQNVALYINATTVVSLVAFAITFTLFSQRILQSHSPRGFVNRAEKNKFVKTAWQARFVQQFTVNAL